MDELSFKDLNNNIKIIYEYYKNFSGKDDLLDYLLEKKYLKDNVLDYFLLNNPELFSFIFLDIKRTNYEINKGLIFVFKDLEKNILEEKKEEIYSILIEKNIFNVYSNIKREERSVDLEIIEFLESFNYSDRNVLKLKEDNGFNILNQFTDKEKIMVF